jgi:hypothetical protein
MGGWVAVRHVDRTGERFFNTGKQVVETLDRLAAAAKASEWERFRSSFAVGYQGEELGLLHVASTKSKDGVEQLSFRSSHAITNDNAAISEWIDYRNEFDTVEAFELHLDRLEKWNESDPVRTRVRLEVIGKLRGSSVSAIDRAYVSMDFDRAGDNLLIHRAAPGVGERIVARQPLFENVARQAGIDFVNRYYPAFLNTPLKFGMIRYGPAGITAVDYDGDGLYDLFIPDGVESRLYRNLGDGRFEDVTARAGLSGLDGVSVALFADYDNDGHKDLFVSRTFSHNQLFHNNGDGTFTDVTAKSGIGDDCCTTVASWADYNNDGLLDLYVGRYLDPRKAIPTTFYARNGEPNQLYRNNGDGTFTNVTTTAKVGDTGLCLGTVFGDYDGDGYPDLYVVNDFGRKTLYHNNRDGTFEDVTVKSGTLAYGAGMSASFADFDNDGKLDIYCTNIRSEHAWYASAPTVGRYMLNSWREGVWATDMPLYWQIFRQSGLEFVQVFQQMASGNTLLRNRGDGTFEDVTVQAGANPVGWFWGASFADFDNDGWQDIYAADGWVYNEPGTEIELEFLNNVVTHQDVYKTGLYFDPKYFGQRSWHGYERNRHLRNNGDGTFSEIGHAAGTDLLTNSRGVAVADFWNRGAMDIAVSASTDRHALLRNNLPATRNWLQVELVGVKSNRDAVGARVTAKCGGRQQLREVVLGDGYGSQNSLRQHFGLGDNSVVGELIVRWPRSGIVQTFRNVAANRVVEITEGRDLLVEKHYRSYKGQ